MANIPSAVYTWTRKATFSAPPRWAAPLATAWSGRSPRIDETESPRPHPEPLAEQPTERSQALETYAQADARDVVIRVSQNAARCLQSRLLQKLHCGPAERLLEHALEMERRKGRYPRHRSHRQRLIVAAHYVVAPPIQPAIQLQARARTQTGEAKSLGSRLKP